MRKSILLFVLLTLFGIPYLLAQGGFRITGQILSAEDNLPVIGVSVVEKGTTNGVITDIDGNYSITVSKSPATLQFSYVGMKTVEKLFTAATRYNVIMQPNTEMVDEVVVVAYGVRKKGTIAGSVSTVKAEKMENVPAATRRCRDRHRDCRSSPIRENPAKPPCSRYAAQTQSTQAHRRCLSSTACPLQVRTSTPSARATSNPFPCSRTPHPPLSTEHAPPTAQW